MQSDVNEMAASDDEFPPSYDDDNCSYGESTRAEPKPPDQEKEFLNQFNFNALDLFDGGYESNDESHGITPSLAKKTPEMVSLKDMLSTGGALALLTGRTKTANQLSTDSNVSSFGSGKNGDTVIDSSVYTPSAPPFELVGIDYGAYKEVLEAEPPEWLPDSSSTACMGCAAPFTVLTRGRHHCRFCGGVFCRGCTQGRCLLPVKFRERNPQRVCDACYDRLDPLQGVLINTVSNAVQLAKHDVMDWTCARGWLNLPIGLSMEHEIYKSSNTLRSYCQVVFSSLCHALSK